METLPPIGPDEALITHMRAGHLLMLRNTYRASLSEERWHDLLEGLPQETLRLLDQEIDPKGWLPIAHTHAMRDAFMRVGLASPFVARGQLTAEAFHASEVGRSILEGLDVLSTIAQWDAVLGELQRGGKTTLDEARPHRARWTFWGIVPFSEYTQDFGRAFFERILQLQGARGANVRFTAPDAGGYNHRYLVEW